MADLSPEEINKKIVSFIPELSGTDKGSITKFIDSAEWVRSQLKPNEQIIFDQLIKYRLPGDIYLKIGKKNIRDFNMLKKSLGDAIMEVMSLDEIYNNCFGCSQKYDELTRKYGYRLGELLDDYINGYKTKYGSAPDEAHLKHLNEKAVQTFKNGLNNMILREKIVTIKANDINEIITETEAIEAMLKASKIQFINHQDIEPKPQQKYFVPPLYCSYCHKPNHLWRECRQRQRDENIQNEIYRYSQSSNQRHSNFCTYCRNSGHNEMQCYRKRGDQNRSNSFQQPFTNQYERKDEPENDYNQFQKQHLPYAPRYKQPLVRNNTYNSEPRTSNPYSDQTILQNEYQSQSNKETGLKANIFKIDYSYSEEDDEPDPIANHSEKKFQATEPRLEDYSHLGIIPDIYLPQNNKSLTRNRVTAQVLSINVQTDTPEYPQMQLTPKINSRTTNLRKEIPSSHPPNLEALYKTENRYKIASENFLKNKLLLNELPRYQNEYEDIPNLNELFSNPIPKCSSTVNIKINLNEPSDATKFKNNTLFEALKYEPAEYDTKSDILKYQPFKIIEDINAVIQPSNTSNSHQNKDSHMSQIQFFDKIPNKITYSSMLKQNIGREYLNNNTPIYPCPEQTMKPINQSATTITKNNPLNQLPVTNFRSMSTSKWVFHNENKISKNYRSKNTVLKIKNLHEKKSDVFTLKPKSMININKISQDTVTTTKVDKQIISRNCTETKNTIKKIPDKIKSYNESYTNKIVSHNPEPQTVTSNSKTSIKWNSYFKAKSIFSENLLHILFIITINILLLRHHSITRDHQQSMLSHNTHPFSEHIKLKFEDNTHRIYQISQYLIINFYFMLKSLSTFKWFQSHRYKINLPDITHYGQSMKAVSIKRFINKSANAKESKTFNPKTFEWFQKHIPNII